MRLVFAALAALLCCPAVATAAPFGELPFQPIRDDRVVKCLEAVGGDRIALVNEIDAETDAVALVRVGADGALTIEAAAPLGVSLTCPIVAAAPSGAAIVAQPAFGEREMEVLVSLREPGGQLERPLRVPGGVGTTIGVPAAAIASSGAAVVAWPETPPAVSRGQRIRIMRRSAGGGFGAPETLRGGADALAEPVVGIDDAGRATVAWEREDGLVRVATAPPGVPFGAPQRLSKATGFGDPLALAVAGDGGALLAYEGVTGIRVFERAPGAVRMTRGPSQPDGPDVERQRPVAALAPGGGASVAWLARGEPGTSIEVALRPPGAAFRSPQVLSAAAGPPALGALPTFESIFREGALQLAVGADGAVVVGWLEEPTIAGGDHPVRVGVAAGTLTGSFEGMALLGGPGRSADGLAVLAAPSAVLWTDNLPHTQFENEFGTENPGGGGRLHRALPGIASQDPAPPEVTLEAPSQRIRSREPVIVRARCSAACDLRGVAGRDVDATPTGLGVAQLAAAGEARIAVRPATDDGLVPRRGGPLRVTVHATAPGGARDTVARIDARVRHARVPPPRRPLDVRVERRGKGLVVTWRTAKPARSEAFEVSAQRRRGDFGTLDYRQLSGRGRTRFRVVFPDVARARWVEVAWQSTEPRFEPGRMTVPVPGAGP